MKNTSIVGLICFGLMTSVSLADSSNLQFVAPQELENSDKSVHNKSPDITIKTKRINDIGRFDKWDGHGVALGGKHETSSGNFELDVIVSNINSNIEQIELDIDGDLYQYKNKFDTEIYSAFDELNGHIKRSRAGFDVPFSIIEKMAAAEKAIIKIKTNNKQIERNFSLGCEPDYNLVRKNIRDNSCGTFNSYINAYNGGELIIDKSLNLGNNNISINNSSSLLPSYLRVYD